MELLYVYNPVSCMQHADALRLAVFLAVALQDDFFGPEVYSDSSLWAKFMTDKQQLLLSCHLYCCT
jgi:hypothetical protein